MLTNRFWVVIYLFIAWMDMFLIRTRGEICEDDICKYEMVIQHRLTMTYTADNQNTYNVAMNETAQKLQIIANSYHTSGAPIGDFVEPEDVITADGVKRNIIVINGEFPGPTIEVKEGVQVEVKVVNLLHSEGVTVHWHGMHMQNNVWMDGAAYITQCPIQPKQTFTYRFIADPAGTHWYHSHLASQRLDGLFGLLIVHKRTPVLPYHLMTVQDWYHVDADQLVAYSPYHTILRGSGDYFSEYTLRDFSSDGAELNAVTYVSTLINGRGQTEISQSLPLKHFEVASGQRYEFRMVHTGSEYTYEIMVDEHKLFVTSSDGGDIRTVEVDSIIVNPGESIAFEIEADKLEGQFWIRADIIRYGIGPYPKEDGIIKGGKAILSYTNINTSLGSQKRICSEHDPCIVFNCPFQGYPRHLFKKCITFNDVTSEYTEEYIDDLYGTHDSDYVEIFLNWGYHIGTSVNARKFSEPKLPLMGDFSEYIIPCDDDICENGCFCTHIRDIPYNRTIQLVMTGYSPFAGHHVIHLHGHSFAVLKMGFPSYNETTGHWTAANDDVTCDTEDYCAHAHWSNFVTPELNTINPPIKNSIVVPARGYVVIRFKSLNPGYWLLHCHQDSHQHEGMSMLLNEGEPFHPHVPSNFPKCETFEWTSQDFKEYISSQMGTSTTDVPGISTTSKQPSSTPNDFSKLEECLVASENKVVLELDVFIGAVVGFVVLGAFLTVVPLLCYSCLTKRNSHDLKS